MSFLDVISWRHAFTYGRSTRILAYGPGSLNSCFVRVCRVISGETEKIAGR